jgi:MFS family permease
MQVNKSLKVLFLLNSIFVFASNLLGPLYVIYVQGIDSKIITISISWATLTLSTVVFMFLMSKLGDKVKEKEFLLAGGFLVRALSWIGYIFVHNIYALLMVQVLLGLGEALGTPAWGVIFAKHLDGSKEIMDYSSWNMLSNVIAAGAVIVGGVVVSTFGFTILFISMSLLASISLIGVLITPRRVL